jgi:SAM-dependent methyltransferase
VNVERLGQRFARLATDVVVRRPALWRVFRAPLTRMFDRLAPVWNDRATPQRLLPLEAALDTLTESPRRVLDVGTGTGSAARALSARWPEAEVVGVDLAPAMIEDARRRATSGRQRYEVADAAALPFEDGLFDLVTLSNMIPFFDELARVVAPGGRVAIAFSRGPETPIYVAPERLRAELARRGFGEITDIAAGAGTAVLAVRADRS